MDIQIVDARGDDVYDNWQIQKMCWLQNFPGMGLGITREDILDWFDETINSNRNKLKERSEGVNKNSNQHLWVARYGKRIVGFAAAKRGEENRLEAMFILPEYQKKGIGSRFMGQVLDWIGPGKKIYVDVVSNNQNARKFYKRYGFIETNQQVDSGVVFSSGASFANIEMVKY